MYFYGKILKREREDNHLKNLDQLKLLFSNFYEAIYIVDTNRQILYFNPKAEAISGFHSNDIIGKFCFHNILNHVNDEGVNLCLSYCPLAKAIEKNSIVEASVFLHHKKGFRVPVNVRAIPYLEDGKVVGAIEVFTDESNKELSDVIYQIAENVNLIDPLTGIFNRFFINKKVDAILKDKEEPFALLFFDIDDFKKVNDTYGHLFGDEVLKNVTQTIKLNAANSYAIRFGGEEILVLKAVKDENEALMFAHKLRLLINETSVRDSGIDYKAKVSIGVAMVDKSKSFNDAIERSDQAMYKAKKAGKNCVYSYLQDKVYIPK